MKSLLLLLLTVPTHAMAPPYQLLCNLQPSPVLGIDSLRPRFSWALPASGRSILPSGYQLQLRRGPHLAWDSGMVATNETSAWYPGPGLPVDTGHSWTVRWSASNGSISAWSAPAWLHTGPRNLQDWQGAELIRGASTSNVTATPATHLRSPIFYLQAPPATATAYISAVGWAELEINGGAVGGLDKLNPGRTNFDMRHMFMAYNVSGMLVEGNNSVGAWLGQGWQSMTGHAPSVRVWLSIWLPDGTQVSIVSNASSWRAVTTGPIRHNDIYQGEVYNSSMELPGWSAPTFNTAAWGSAVVGDEFEGYDIKWQPMNPIRKLELNDPVGMERIRVSSTNETVYVYEFKQNAAGWVQLRLEAGSCPVNTVIDMYFSEVLCGRGTTRWSPPCSPGQLPGNGQPGTVDQRNLRGSWFNSYVCDGRAEAVVWEPRFMYTGHRFVQLHGFPATPTDNTLKQRVVHSDIEASPDTESEGDVVPRVLAGAISMGTVSNGSAPSIDGPQCYEGEGCHAIQPTNPEIAVLDQISHNVRWTLVDNLHSVPEDCDQRNERWGWMADASVSSEANFQYHWIGPLYSNWLDLMVDVQSEPQSNCYGVRGSHNDSNYDQDGKPECRGAVGDLTPGKTPADKPGDPSWMFAFPLVYSYQHRYMGEIQLAARLFPAIQDYAQFLVRMAGRGNTGLVSWKKYGDWLQPGRVQSTDLIGEMSSGFNYIQTLRIVRNTARALGQSEIEHQYQTLMHSARTSFHSLYWNQSAGWYGDGTQTPQVYALYGDVVPAELRSTVMTKLVSLIQHGNSVPPSAVVCDSTPCLDTGILATKWLMELLSMEGRTDLGLALAFKTEFPSWGYMAAMNATTVWEHWEYMNGAGMNSHNHPALASVGAWFYRWVVGLRLNDGTPEEPTWSYGQGWREVLFAPGCVTDPKLQAAQGRVPSIHGPIQASWQVTGNGELEMKIKIPVGTRAEVHVPALTGVSHASHMQVLERGQLVWQPGVGYAPNKVPGITEAYTNDKVPGVTASQDTSPAGHLVLRVNSGDYVFQVKAP